MQYENQSLVLGPNRKPLSSVTNDYEGPAYVYDLDILRDRFAQMKTALDSVEIYYAMKANSHSKILKELCALGSGVDVVSGGEIRRAQEAGFKPSQMIYSGVGKTHRELKAAIAMEIGQINVESIPELLRIAGIATELGKRAQIVFRLNPDVSIETHPYIATGLHNNKFGMAFTDLPELTAILKQYPKQLNFRGVSLHLGSQMHQLSGFRDALKILKPVFLELREEFPSVDTFDFGGGLGIFYDKQDLALEEQMLLEYAAIMKEELGGLGARLQTEPGRWLLAHAGVLVTQVQYLKKNILKNFVIVDTGMHHLLRPTLYSAHHEVWSMVEKKISSRVFDVVGPICESGDFIGKDRALPDLAELDFLVIADVGAYGFVMRSDYNLQDPPREVFI
ncbi:MAG: diaminopimelate decarboxylase [Bdellovibrionaceae bacterium]|nr:diaminopimelate decarboxylase [Pseudobdellovibrionaceae bacterium]